MAEKADQKDRLREVQKVLVWAFALNLTVCVIKIALGFTTGVMAITADGFHSLGDSLANVVGFIGIRLARRKPDGKHGYGYERYEAVTTLVIVSLILITCWKVFEAGIGRLMAPEKFRIQPVMMLVMAASMAINVIIIIYEGGAGRRLGGELLVADSNETRSDLWVSGGVMASALVVSYTRWYWLDGAVTVGIGFLIMYVIWEIIKPTARLLADHQVVEPTAVKAIVATVPGARFCHAVRSRGKMEGFFLDLHLGVDADISVAKAHDDVCHRVKLALHDHFPGLKSALIHIEPDNEAGRNRGNSVFRRRDSYGHG